MEQDFWAMIIYFPDGPSRFRMKRRNLGGEGGMVRKLIIRDIPLYYYTTILLYYYTTIPLYHYTTILLYYYTTILLYYYSINVSQFSSYISISTLKYNLYTNTATNKKF